MKRVLSLIGVMIFIVSLIIFCFFFARIVMISRDITGYYAEEALYVVDYILDLGISV